MKVLRRLCAKNLKRHPVRTAALLLISALLAFSVFGGSVIIRSLRNGLASYSDRLGADIVVVPYQNKTTNAFESILLQGVPGTYSISENDYNKILQTAGIDKAAPQFFLASTSSGCCSVAVQIIGFDPELDFTVQPWIRESYSDTLKTGDIIVGSDLNIPTDRSLMFYDTACTVVAQLDRTGTGLDTAVYANMDTIRLMIENAKALGFTAFDGIDPDHAVSSVMIRVAEGYEPERVTNDINIHVRHIIAAQSTSMLSGISGGLENVSGIIRILMTAVWISAMVVLAIAFALITHERAKEFAVLRITGASRSMVSKMLLLESSVTGGAGALLGIAAGALVVVLFRHGISDRLELPYLLPGAGWFLLCGFLTLILCVAAAAVTSAIAAHRIGRNESALLLREGI